MFTSFLNYIPIDSKYISQIHNTYLIVSKYIDILDITIHNLESKNMPWIQDITPQVHKTKPYIHTIITLDSQYHSSQGILQQNHKRFAPQIHWLPTPLSSRLLVGLSAGWLTAPLCPENTRASMAKSLTVIKICVLGPQRPNYLHTHCKLYA